MLWTRDGDVDWVRQTKAQIDEAVGKSLKRLQTDYIDLYQLHWPDRPIGLFGGRMDPVAYSQPYEKFEDILAHLDTHVKAGRIRHIGVSNETPFGVMRFIAESEARGLPRMASIQNAYNLVNRTFEDGGLEEVCVREDVGLLSYSPLGQGYLTGKYRNGALPEGSRKALFNRLQRYENAPAARAIESYLVLAEKYGIDPSQLAIRFCDTRNFMASTIIGATTMDQLKICIDAFDLEWTDLVPADDATARNPLRGLMPHDEAGPAASQPVSSGVKTDWNGQIVRMSGFVVPIDYSGTGVTSFLLVPYVGACVHVPPPPANQLVLVSTETPYESKGLFEPVTVTGMFGTASVATQLADVGYALSADAIEPYEG